MTATSSLSSTVQPGGPRAGANGTNFFNVEGIPAFASFGVLDFTVSSFNLAFPATAVSNLSLSLTEANSSFTTASGALAFYLVTDTTTSIAAGSGTTLAYQSANAPNGLGTQLGANPFLLGTGVFSTNSGSTGSGTVDTYSFSLSSDAQTYLLNQLNNSSAIVRLVVAPNDSTGASTWAGSTSTSTRPTLSLTTTLSQPSLIWVGGTGTWNATGGTDWSGGPWDATKNAAFNTGSGTVTLGTPVTTAGITFNTTGYTIAGSGANPLTLSSSAAGNVISVTNAADTATISAEIAGTTGLTKSGAGTLALTGVNSFSGAVTINSGALAVGADSNLGNAANGIVLNSGIFKSTAAFTVGSGHTLSGTGTIDASAGAIVFSGPINATALSVANNSAVTFSGASAAFTGVAVGSGSTLTITAPTTSAVRPNITSDGTVQLNVDNSAYTIGFQMNKGAGTVGPTVILGTNTALGTGSLFFNAGTLSASTALTGANAISTPVSYGGSVTLAGADMEFIGAFTFFGSQSKTLTVNNNTTIATDMGTAAFSTLIKAGSGKLTLESINSYVGGTQVLAGTLELASGGALGTGDVSVAAGALLRLDTEVSINDGSNLTLFSTGASFGMLDLNFDSSFSETVNSLFAGGAFLAPGIYDATNLPDYITGTGKLVVTAIPEPQVTLLLLVGGILLAAVKPVRSRFRRLVKL